MESVLDFLYRGEVKIYQEDINDFLTAAEELELKDLTGQQPKEDVNFKEIKFKESKTKLMSALNFFSPKKEPSSAQENENPHKNMNEDIHSFDSFVSTGRTVAVLQFDNNDEINATIGSLLEKIDGTYNCKICDQKSTHKATLKRHIESKHTQGGFHPCQVCGKIFRSSHCLKIHMSNIHKHI